METAQYNFEFESTNDNYDASRKQGFYVRKLSFDGNFSPMTHLGENNMEDAEFDFLWRRDKKPAESQTPSICYRKLQFGGDNEKEDFLNPCIQSRDFNKDQIFGSNDFSTNRTIRKLFTPNRADTVHDFDMQCDPINKLSQEKHENAFSIKRGNCLVPEDLFLSVSRNNSHDNNSQVGSTAVPADDFEMELESSDCFESTPRKFLPTCKNYRNPGLSTIAPQTLLDLMNQNLNYVIIDCRYDYEYHGGHIKGAIHIDSPEALETLFITHRQFLYNKSILDLIKQNPSLLNSPSELYNALQMDNTEPCAPIVVFHCEFSQKRGPRGLRMLREIDQTLNANTWPNVFYPEVYILDGGYRNFRGQFPAACCPENGYIRMIDEEYKAMYSLARQKEKGTWGTKESSKPKIGKMLGLQRSKTMFPY